MELRSLYHLFSRTGFGTNPSEAEKWKDFNVKEMAARLVNPNTRGVGLSTAEKRSLPGKQALQNMSPEEKKELLKEANGKIRDLNTDWMKRLVVSENPLLEKTTLFWHGHFSCRIGNPYTLQELNNLMREMAFAPFKDLLLAVSKSAAMLQFLSNRQNHKLHPNENFARELMELFTIGRGNYSEDDIKESARAFTGWSFVPGSFEFHFNERDHDDGTKTFMGKTGNFTGEDIINIILERKETAQFLTKKLYRFFVSESFPEARLTELSDFYYQCNYDTGALLTKIFASTWFYEPANQGCLIKSPVELLVGFSRTIGMVPSNEVLLKMQRALGQMLFFPPNVAGWPGGKSWIDSSTLMLRLKLPSLILNGGKIDIMEKDEMPEESFNLPDTLSVKPDSKPFFVNEMPEAILTCLIRPELSDKKSSLLLQSNESKKQLVLKLMSIPEYQMA